MSRLPSLDNIHSPPANVHFENFSKSVKINNPDFLSRSDLVKVKSIVNQFFDMNTEEKLYKNISGGSKTFDIKNQMP